MPDDITDKIIRQIKESFLVDFVQRLIGIPSFKTEETRVARFLAGFFRRRGYEVDLQEVEPGRFQTIATLKGTGGGKRLMLNGHIDIDPLAMGWKRDPWTPSVEGDRVYGAGAFNMKGGIASMVAAAEAIRKSGAQVKGDLVVACVVGELQGGVGTVHALETVERPDMAIVAEPYGQDSLLTVHAGWVEMVVDVLGNSRHISQKEEAVDAIEKMAEVVSAINGLKLTHTPYPALPTLPRIHVGALIGGLGRDHVLNGTNFVSDFCSALVDVRTVPGQTSEMVVADVRRALERIKASDPQFKYEIECPPPAKYGVLQVEMEPMDMSTDEYIVQVVSRNVESVTGKPPAHVGVRLPSSYAGNDTAHIWKAGIPCVLYGPGGGWDEREDEPDAYIRVSDMEVCAKVIALTALKICNEDK
ncbi:MAG: M20 family metallopeptidase [Dehalococcoidia bacterium]